MPVVTVDPNEYEKVELKSAPPDGYVMLRPLPYGMKLERRDKAMKMMMKATPPQRQRGRLSSNQQPQEQTIEFETASEWAQAFDFSYCIGEHNLQNKDQTLVDFANPLSIKLLDPRVGSEIEEAINTLNESEDEESLEDFLKRSTVSSELSTTQPSEMGSTERSDTTETAR